MFNTSFYFIMINQLIRSPGSITYVTTNTIKHDYYLLQNIFLNHHIFLNCHDLSNRGKFKSANLYADHDLRGNKSTPESERGGNYVSSFLKACKLKYQLSVTACKYLAPILLPKCIST